MRYKQTLENFVLSAANEIPVIVVKSILTKDGPNRIILYGPSGSGKTRGRGTQENRTQEFSDQLHSLDLLLIDDVSLLAYKNETTKFFVSLATDIDGPRIVTTSSVNLDSTPGFTTKCTQEIEIKPELVNRVLTVSI